ncbi:MAG TPA: hypothetical protein VGS22_21240 [Thermoanaerobaculia bacterium]|jgi:hypothetical protein|nr:hypothetical protein [Thermoanaerobaculia bacterium]
MLGVAMACGMLARLLSRNDRRLEQEERDRRAQRIADEVSTRNYQTVMVHGGQIPFALYLRPFAVEGQLRNRHSWVSLITTRPFEPYKKGFDFEISKYFEGIGILLICIGVHGSEGAGQVITDDATWLTRFRELAQSAESIVVVPGCQPGIIAEIRWLRVTGLLVRTVFFKPKGYPRSEWVRASKALEEEDDIVLPGYVSKTVSFRLYSSGNPNQILTWKSVFGATNARRGQKQIEAVLTNHDLPD